MLVAILWPPCILLLSGRLVTAENRLKEGPDSPILVAVLWKVWGLACPCHCILAEVRGPVMCSWTLNIFPEGWLTLSPVCWWDYLGPGFLSLDLFYLNTPSHLLLLLLLCIFFMNFVPDFHFFPLNFLKLRPHPPGEPLNSQSV